METQGPNAAAGLFLASGVSLSSGLGDGVGPPGLRADEPTVGVLGFVGDNGVCAFGCGGR